MFVVIKEINGNWLMNFQKCNLLRLYTLIPFPFNNDKI